MVPPPPYPGVFVEEVPSRGPPITDLPTGVAALAGWTPQGPAGMATSVGSWGEFEQLFGGLDPRNPFGHCVGHFFANGGKRAFVVRLVAADGAVLQPDEPAFEAALLTWMQSDELADFDLLCVPGETNPAIVAQVQAFCRVRRAFYIVDAPRSAPDLSRLPDAAICGDDAINSALYFPWVRAPDPMSGGALADFPPSGFVAGVYARVDAQRGVWKAPAGTEAHLVGAVGLSRAFTAGDAAVLNAGAVNSLRSVPGQAPLVWGARTLRGQDANASEWKYVPVRRLALFLEGSIFRGTQWVIFEPNGELLWSRIRARVGAFLDGLFRAGAFQGTTASQAYFVKCDAQTMTQLDLHDGVVRFLVGFAALKPGEFQVLEFRMKGAPR